MLQEMLDANTLQNYDLDFLSISEKDLIRILYNDIESLKFEKKASLSAFEAYYDERRHSVTRH